MFILLISNRWYMNTNSQAHGQPLPSSTEQIAHLMHFNKKNIHSEIDIAKHIRKGIPFKIVEEVCSELQISQQELSQSIGINIRTLTRRKKENKLHADEGDRLYRLVRIYARAIEVFEDKKTAIRWLNTPKTTLGGEIPLSFLDTDAGTREIEQLLGRIEYGIIS